MKKTTLTEDKAEKTPTGGVLVGKRKGQTIIHNKGTLSGYLVGKTHAEGGIKAVNKSTGQPLEMQGGEVVITAPAVSDQTKNEFNGKMMTNREILSQINVNGGGVAFAKGGDIPKDIKRTGASYKYGGKTMTDHEIYKKITGGHLAEGMTLSQIAKMHKVTLKELQKQVDMGMKAESEHTSSKREQMKIVKDHLFENPKYYTLLKKAGLKHGGKVRRGSLVRDAKSGNTPARDLNNYNDVLDLQADGLVGAETGLFATGGSVKPYDANMDGDSADMMFVRGGATDVSVNKWSEIPDSFKNVRLPKKIDWSAYPSNEGLYEIVKPFLGVEDLRPAMQGINFDNNGITVTNAHILLTIPTNEHDFQGIYKKVKGQDGFDKLDEKFPNYAQVIPNEKDSILSLYIDIDKLLTYCKIASNYSGSQEVVFKINDEQMSFFPDLMINFLSSLIKLTGRLSLNVSFTTNKKALVFSKYPAYVLGKDEIGLIMPYVYGSQKKLGASNEKKNAELNVYFDFDDNEIHNSDGSVVTDWQDKPIKERAKRTPKTTASKTSKQIDLSRTKIWIGDNPELSKKVQEKAFELGWEWLDGKSIGRTEQTSLYFDKEKKIGWFNDREEFDSFDRFTEIFPSDLGIDLTTSTELPDFINISDKDAVKDLPQPLQDLIVYELIREGATEKGIEFTLKSSTINGAVDWAKSKDGIDFWINTSNGNLLSFKEKYGKSGEKATQLLAELKAKKSGTPAKETEKIEVFRLKGLSIDEAQTESDFGVYGATELLENIKLLKSTFPERESFPYRIYDFQNNAHDSIIFGKGIETISDLTVAIVNKPNYDNYDWTEFFAYGTDLVVSEIEKIYKRIDEIVEKENIKSVITDAFYLDSKIKDFDIVDYETNEVYTIRKHNSTLGAGVELYNKKRTQNLLADYLEWKKITSTSKPVEQPKPSKTQKPKRNFELERKYLSQRISDLAKELELKKPILSNEEVAFYQREINSFILKLRKLNDAEMSLKSIEDRVRGVYGLKISALENEYPETDMVSINGLKSQLTEKEYFNVRTPEFKSFFGDWETAYLTDNYAGVSKVINPVTKEPQTVFHGTNVLFVNWQTYETNNAHYFAVKREFSEFFATTWEERTDKAGVDSQILKRLNPNRGSFLLRCFIDVKNPIDFSRFGVEKYPIREFLTFLRVNYNIGDFDFWTNITTHSGITQDTEVYAWQIIRLWQSFTKYVKVFTTYDGYIFYEYIPTKTYGGLENASLSYCAFDSNQIKFTDAYEFNALSNDSRFDLGGIL